MIPLRLQISGFLSYRQPVEIDFTAFDLACISGHNGAGKSSILDALTWVLFGEARQRGEAVINLQSDAAEVTLTFAYEGNRYRVQRRNERGKPVRLEFHIASAAEAGSWKPLTERTLRETQQRINQTLRLDYETFVNAAFFLQGEADRFTQQRPADRKRILGNILGLEVWDVYRQRAAVRRKQVRAEIDLLNGQMMSIQQELDEEPQRREALARLEAELQRLEESRRLQAQTVEQIKQTMALLEEQRRQVEALQRQLEDGRRQRAELQAELQSRQDERARYADLLARAEEIRADYQAWQQARAALARWDEMATQFHAFDKERQQPLQQIEAERARIEQQIATLQEQSRTAETQQAELDDLRRQLAAQEETLAALEEQIEKRDALKEELEAVRQQQAAAQAENPSLKAQMDELKQRIDRLSEVEGAACPLCGQPLSPQERQRLMEELQTQGKALGDRYRANRDALQKAEEGIKALEAALEAYADVEERSRQQARVFDQIVARIQHLEEQKRKWEEEGYPRLQALQTALAEEQFAPQARARLQEIDARLKALGYDPEAHQTARQAEQQGRAAEDALRLLEKATGALGPLEREIASLQKRLDELEETIHKQEAEYQQASEALQQAEADAPDLREAQRALLDLQEKENLLRQEVGAARQRVDVLAVQRKRLKQLEAERETLAQHMARLEQLETAFGKDGVPALLIEQALPELEARANEFLDRLSGGEMTVRFETQRALKSRDGMRETLDIHISDRLGTRSYETYSGGEAFRVNFAIRLALSEILARRAGARLQTLVIDEGFGSQDESGRQRLIEAINLIRQDFAKILVITHIDALKDAFPARLEVEKTAQGSQVNLLLS
ncbi:MAG: SMC family ATPase [Anaerolineae bacterium]|nr:MAG: SMC family ATPase [Anaerolineae bacterium]